MDPSAYKDLQTRRGFNYHYFYSAPQDNKPTLLLLHGFPSTSYDWHHVVEFFKPAGYGILVPDLLGYGKTEKPTDPENYRMKLMVEDMVDILEAEKLEKVVSIAHDWGSGLNSRLANYYPERFAAFAFFALGYFPPYAGFDLEVINAASIKKNGYTKFGYWKFFAREDAAKIVEDHMASFLSLIYNDEKGLAQKHFCPEGALEEWLLGDRTSSSAAPYVTEEERKVILHSFERGGLTGPLCWYKAFMLNHTPKDDAEIPREKGIITKPVFFGAALQDSACVADDNKAIVAQLCPNATVADFDTGHWVLHQAPERVNEELLKWIQSLNT
ncbi:alpha/beta-hydrolase [Phellopilus nigrolimitatus]|nr:alpha/beta-hydrolase [Phellopilus nigrolimitatus]